MMTMAWRQRGFSRAAGRPRERTRCRVCTGSLNSRTFSRAGKICTFRRGFPEVRKTFRSRRARTVVWCSRTFFRPRRFYMLRLGCPRGEIFLWDKARSNQLGPARSGSSAPPRRRYNEVVKGDPMSRTESCRGGGWYPRNRKLPSLGASNLAYSRARRDELRSAVTLERAAPHGKPTVLCFCYTLRAVL